MLLALLTRLEQDADVDGWRERYMAAEDPHTALRRFAEWSAALFGRGRDVLSAARAAQHTGELREFWEEEPAHRRVAVDRVVEVVTRAGALRDDLDVDTAGDRMWVLTGPDVYLLCTEELGWSDEKYVDWLTETLADQLIEP